MDADFFAWIKSQKTDVHYDVYPLQYKFDDQRKETFVKIFSFLKQNLPFVNNDLFTFKTVETMYEVMKDIQIMTASDLIQLLVQLIIKKQILFIQRITAEENVPYLLGCNIFRHLSRREDCNKEEIFRLILRVHVKTLFRIPAIIQALDSVDGAKTEENVVRVLQKNMDERIIQVFNPLLFKKFIA